MFNENGQDYDSWEPLGAVLSGLATAFNYIPEVAWNETSSANGLRASGGGASALFPQPAWQTGPGVPNNGARNVPDLSFNAATTHDPYLVFSNGSLYTVGGTSVPPRSLPES